MAVNVGVSQRIPLAKGSRRLPVTRPSDEVLGSNPRIAVLEQVLNIAVFTLLRSGGRSADRRQVVTFFHSLELFSQSLTTPLKDLG